MNERLGVFGGTFDPIHVGHLYIANAVCELAHFNRVLFVPIGSPSHREVHAAASDRAHMVKLAIADNNRFAFDETGLQQPAPAYTYDTLALLQRRHSTAALSFIAGIDSLVRSVWRRLEDVARAVEKFYVVAREQIAPEELHATLAALPADLAAKFTLIRLPLVDVSASQIREDIARERPVRYLVPDAVLDYIAEKKLYSS